MNRLRAIRTLRPRRGRQGSMLALCAATLLLTFPGGAVAAGIQPGENSAPSVSSANTFRTGVGDKTRLFITYTPSRHGRNVVSWSLVCEPPGGDHPQPSAACAALANRGGKALVPVHKNRYCSSVFGGSQSATITGLWHGETVKSQFSRRNGCEIARWNALTPLLPAIR